MKGTALRPAAGRIGRFSLAGIALAAALGGGTFALVSAVTGSSTLAAGATLHVVASGGGDTPGCPSSSPCSLASAMAQAKGVDPPTIALGPGTYLGTMVIDFSVNIVGAGEGSTFLKNVSPASPVVVADAGPVSISQLTVTGGMGAKETVGAGGVDNAEGVSLTLNDVIVTGNTYSDGIDGAGGIANLGTLHLDNSAVVRNSASVSKSCSGGIANDGTMTIENSIISQNSCTGQYQYGVGGISNGGLDLVENYHQTVLDIYQSTISINSSAANNDCKCAQEASGGISNAKLGSLYLSDTSVTQNSATALYVALGGGLFNLGTATVTASLMSGNTVTGFQGSGGGAIYNYNILTISGPTGITANNGNFGGGLLNDCTGVATLTGTSLHNDIATVGPEIYNGGTLTTTAVTVNPAQVVQDPSHLRAHCNLGLVRPPA